MKKVLFYLVCYLCPIILVAQIKENVTKYLPRNYDKTGKTDYTEYIQKAVNFESEVVFPNFPLGINYNGINLKSNKILSFQPNSKLIMLPNNKGTYRLLNIEGIQNVQINNPILEGDRNKHQGSAGEWGMGIKIMSSSNITIINPRISNFWGDGIYLGRDAGSNVINSNIKIVGGTINNNRRNGVSLVSCTDVTISNITINNTNGARPEAGIDIEPNNNNDEVTNIKLVNIKTNNNLRGILIALNSFKGKSKKTVNITIDGHKDNYSKYALGLALDDNNSNNMPLEGSIDVRNVQWSNNTDPIQYYKLSRNKIKVNISNVKMLNQRFKIQDLKNKYKQNSEVAINEN